MASKLLKSVMRQSDEKRRTVARQAVLRHLARLGGQVFGPVAAGARREFFCLDRHTWVWHEEWTDETGRRHAMTTRYDIRPNGVIMKSQGPHSYQRLTPSEERNFRAAAEEYYQQASHELHRLAAA